MFSKILFTCFALFSLCFGRSPPQPVTQFVSDYEVGVVPSGSGSNYRPFFRGKIVIDLIRPDALGGSFMQFTNDEDAPFLLETSLVVTPNSEGYQFAGDGRCVDFGYVGDYLPFIIYYLYIPPYAIYEGTKIVNNDKCTIWTWDADGYNVTAAVRVSDLAMIYLSNSELGISLTFSNVIVGKPDSNWFAAPIGPCNKPDPKNPSFFPIVSNFFTVLKEKKSNLNLFKLFTSNSKIESSVPSKIHTQDPPIPSLAQVFMTDYEFGFLTHDQNWFPLFTGHVGLDYPKRNLRFVLQDDQEADVPFILQTISLSHSNATNSSDVNGYQFLERGSCWKTPKGFLDFMLDFDFAIPSDASFQGNVTINNTLCEVWQWNYQGDINANQRVSVDPKTGAFYRFEIIIDSILTFIWNNRNIILNSVPDNLFNPPMGCLPWN